MLLVFALRHGLWLTPYAVVDVGRQNVANAAPFGVRANANNPNVLYVGVYSFAKYFNLISHRGGGKS